MRYAVFPLKRRLVIDDHGQTKTYDTGNHQISGVSQSQSTDSTLTFVSQHGVVRVSDLASSSAAFGPLHRRACGGSAGAGPGGVENGAFVGECWGFVD